MGCVAHLGQKKNTYKVLAEKPEGNNNWKNIGLHARIILR
jgi:hypothetical protein